MLLYWIVREHEGVRTFFIQQGYTPTDAFLKSAIAGHEGGKPVEYHELDVKTGRKVPKRMIGRVLTQDEAQAVLGKLDGH